MDLKETTLEYCTLVESPIEVVTESPVEVTNDLEHPTHEFGYAITEVHGTSDAHINIEEQIKSSDAITSSVKMDDPHTNLDSGDDDSFNIDCHPFISDTSIDEDFKDVCSHFSSDELDELSECEEFYDTSQNISDEFENSLTDLSEYVDSGYLSSTSVETSITDSLTMCSPYTPHRMSKSFPDLLLFTTPSIEVEFNISRCDSCL